MAKEKEIIWAYLFPKGRRPGRNILEITKYIYKNHPKWNLYIIHKGEPEGWGFRKIPGGYKIYARKFHFFKRNRKDDKERSGDFRDNSENSGFFINPSEVQSILFDREIWDVKEAQRWLKEHGYKYKSYEITENYYRFKQRSPRHYKRFRILEFGKDTGIKAVIGFKNPDLTFNPDDSIKLETMKRFPIEELEKRIKEIEELIQKGDGQQAAEKVYSVVESCIKILAEKEKIPEYYEAIRNNRWFSELLENAAEKLAEKLKNERISEIWDKAWALHIWSFHENRWSFEKVKRYIISKETNLNIAQEMLEITKKHLGI
jgi:hypothetical protein